MSDNHNFENELANLMAKSEGEKAAPAQNTVQPVSSPSTPDVQPQRPKEKQLSQAEIDAILASMLG